MKSSDEGFHLSTIIPLKSTTFWSNRAALLPTFHCDKGDSKQFQMILLLLEFLEGKKKKNSYSFNRRAIAGLKKQAPGISRASPSFTGNEAFIRNKGMRRGPRSRAKRQTWQK